MSEYITSMWQTVPDGEHKIVRWKVILDFYNFKNLKTQFRIFNFFEIITDKQLHRSGKVLHICNWNSLPSNSCLLEQQL